MREEQQPQKIERHREKTACTALVYFVENNKFRIGTGTYDVWTEWSNGWDKFSQLEEAVYEEYSGSGKTVFVVDLWARIVPQEVMVDVWRHDGLTRLSQGAKTAEMIRFGYVLKARNLSSMEERQFKGVAATAKPWEIKDIFEMNHEGWEVVGTVDKIYGIPEPFTEN